MTGITEIAESLSSELKRRLPKQRKTQRTKLALLVSTMLDVRSANLMDLAAGLPLEADRTDMRYQWIVRLLGNPLVISDAIMEPFAREVLERAGADGEPLGLILDQVSDRWPGGSRTPRARSGSRPRRRCSRWSSPGFPRRPGSACWATVSTAPPT
jgi:hypothetical protein